MRKKSFVFATALFLLVLFSGVSFASFPEKPITIFNSSSAGSPTDLLAREVAHYAEKYLGQPMVVVNKTGGGGGVMFASLMSQPSDGYTIASSTAAQIAALQAQLKGQFAFEDFDFLVNVQLEPYAIASLVDGPFSTLQEAIDYAKKGNSLMVGGQGTGSSMHLMMLEIARQADFKFTWLPYGGGSESITNLLGGHAQIISTAPATAHQYVEAGKIRLLAVSGEKMMEHLPDVPTLKELGLDITLAQYRGFIAKKGLPVEVKEKIVAAIEKAVKEPGFVEFMKKTNQADGYMNSSEFAAYAKEDFDKVGRMTKELLTSPK